MTSDQNFIQTVTGGGSGVSEGSTSFHGSTPTSTWSSSSASSGGATFTIHEVSQWSVHTVATVGPDGQRLPPVGTASGTQDGSGTAAYSGVSSGQSESVGWADGDYVTTTGSGASGSSGGDSYHYASAWSTVYNADGSSTHASSGINAAAGFGQNSSDNTYHSEGTIHGLPFSDSGSDSSSSSSYPGDWQGFAPGAGSLAYIGVMPLAPGEADDPTSGSSRRAPASNAHSASSDLSIPPRLISGLQIAGGIWEILAGAGLVKLIPVTFGLSGLPGFVLIFHGFDTLWTGVQGFRHDRVEHTQTYKYVLEQTGSPTKALLVDAGIPIVAGGAGVLSTRLTRARSGVGAAPLNCFAAGTPLLIPTGDKLIEQFQQDDWILARNEFDPDGPLEAKRVEEVFVRLAPILHVHVGGQVIRTTAEHPFFVYDKGWLPAGQLQVGDRLVSHDGHSIPVDELFNTGEWETVYNLRVADFHTYFVGARAWGFSLWAHNASYSATAGIPGFQKHHVGQDAALRGLTDYSYNGAPVVLLRGGSFLRDSPHYLANVTQISINANLRATGATTQTILQVVRTARQTLAAAGVSRPGRRQLLSELVEYLRTLPGIGALTRVPIPG